MTPARLGLRFALVVLILDQLSKWWILGPFALPAKVTVPVIDGFFNLTMVWNRGVSMGLFRADSDAGRWLLTGLTGAIAALVAYWLLKEQSRAQALALGGILGGAIGNIADRVRFGAVADFLHFHLMGYSFYVFNLADAAITLGVAALLFIGLARPRHDQKAETNE